jgi:hypothetical protein
MGTNGMMAEMSRMMAEMGRMMGGPPRKPLMPRLLDIERLGEAERNALRVDADARAQRGLEQLERGSRALAAARGARDDAAMSRAVATLREGLELWETGTAVQRALALPAPAARATALRWFTSQMNLDLQQAVARGPGGFSPTHLALVAVLVLAVTGGVLLYAYRVRRSLALLARLTRGGPS